MQEEDSDEAAKLWGAAARIASSRVLYVEARAALSAAIRQRRIRAKLASSLRMSLDSLVDAIDLIELNSHVAAVAGDVAEVYGLSANDAIHLASALTQPHASLIMMSWDAELRHAAAQAGLALAPA